MDKCPECGDDAPYVSERTLPAAGPNALFDHFHYDPRHGGVYVHDDLGS
jgi:hypothetical protein